MIKLKKLIAFVLALMSVVFSVSCYKPDGVWDFFPFRNNDGKGFGYWECEELYIDGPSYRQLKEYQNGDYTYEGVVYVELKLKGEQPFKGVVKVKHASILFIYPGGEDKGAIVIAPALYYDHSKENYREIVDGKEIVHCFMMAEVIRDDYYKKYTGKVFEKIYKALELPDIG